VAQRRPGPPRTVVIVGCVRATRCDPPTGRARGR